MFASILIIGLLVAVEAAKPAATPAHVKAYIASSRAERLTKLADAKASLERWHRRGPAGPTRYAKDMFRQQIGEMEQRIKEIGDPLVPYYGRIFLYDATAGAIGWTDETLVVVQVVDGNNAILEYAGAQAADFALTRKQEVRDFDDKLFWMIGPTAGLANGDTVPLHGVVYISGTKQYKTRVGSQTVPVFETPDLNTFDFLDKSEPREWTSTGGHKTTASFVQLQRGKVTLMNEQGKTVEVPLDDLSAADQTFVREYRKLRAR